MKNVTPLSNRLFLLWQLIFLILIGGISAATAAETQGFYLIKNRWNGAYLFADGRVLRYGAANNANPNSEQAYQWTFVDRGGNYFDIKNRKTGDLINIEFLQDYVQSDKSCPPVVGDSSKWAIEKAANGYVRLRNGWHMNDYLHIQDLKGYAQHGMMYPVWESAQWQIVKVTDNVKGRNDASNFVLPSREKSDVGVVVNSQSRPNTPTVAQPSNVQPTANQADNSQPRPFNSINAVDYGAVGDGRTDNQAMLQRAIDAATQQRKILWIPPGTYNHSGVLTLNGTVVQGAGSPTVLNATNPDQGAIRLTGNQSSISKLKTTVVAPYRSSMPNAAAILVQSASEAVVKDLIIQGASSNGVRLDGASSTTVTTNLVLGTNADGIALMNGSTNNVVHLNVVYQAGDDSYSDDSYVGDARQDEQNIFSGNLIPG